MLGGAKSLIQDEPWGGICGGTAKGEKAEIVTGAPEFRVLAK